MDLNSQEIFQEAIKKAESDIIIFFVIIAVVLIVFIIPLYAMILNDRKANRKIETERIKNETEAINIRQDKYMEHERQIIAVITANTKIMASLKTMLERDELTIINSLTHIHDRIDKQCAICTEHCEMVAKIITTIGEVIRNHGEVEEDIKKILLIVSKQEG